MTGAEAAFGQQAGVEARSPEARVQALLQKCIAEFAAEVGNACVLCHIGFGCQCGRLGWRLGCWLTCEALSMVKRECTGCQAPLPLSLSISRIVLLSSMTAFTLFISP